VTHELVRWTELEVHLSEESLMRECASEIVGMGPVVVRPSGEVFDRVKPKLAVYTHVGLVGGPAARATMAADLIPRTRSTYAGRVEVGEDLMTIIIGDRMDVRRFNAPVR